MWVTCRATVYPTPSYTVQHASTNYSAYLVCNPGHPYFKIFITFGFLPLSLALAVSLCFVFISALSLSLSLLLIGCNFLKH